jgi:ribosomal protein L16 Arg81 hydroxylase
MHRRRLMVDIVERLRQPWLPSHLDHTLMRKAAAEITRLRAELEQCRTLVAEWVSTGAEGQSTILKLLEERTRLKGEVAELAEENALIRRLANKYLAEVERKDAALAFYADGSNWSDPFGMSSIINEGGKIARAALTSQEPRT